MMPGNRFAVDCERPVPIPSRCFVRTSSDEMGRSHTEPCFMLMKQGFSSS